MAEENMEGTTSSSRSPRFTHWVAFLIFSTITLGSSVETKNHTEARDEDANSNQKWAVACSAVTFTITAIVVLLHLNSVTSLLIVGTKIEGVICLILAAFWAATVAIISDSSNGLAVDESGAVDNGNLYYFSWAGFVTSILLLVSYLRSAYHVDVAGEIKTRSARLTIWSACLATSLIVMGASANIFDHDCADSDQMGTKYCKRTLFGLILGTISTVFALIIVGMKIATAKAPFMLEALFSVCLIIAWAFGVAYITSKQGPGSALGNLYYFTWGSFLSTFFLTASCSEDYQTAKAMANQPDQGHTPGGEIQVESLDEQI